MNRDPLASSTREPFAYAASNPMNAVDPTGLDWYNPTTWTPVDMWQEGWGDFREGVDEHKGTIATGVAVAGCIGATFGTCAALSGVAFGVRSWDAIDDQGARGARGDIAVDGLVTTLTLGVGGLANRGMKIAGPLKSLDETLEFAPASRGADWAGRGLFGLYDLAMLSADLLRGGAYC